MHASSTLACLNTTANIVPSTRASFPRASVRGNRGPVSQITRPRVDSSGDSEARCVHSKQTTGLCTRRNVGLGAGLLGMGLGLPEGANAASGLDQYLEYAPYDPFPNAPDSIPGKANSVKSVTPNAPAADGNQKAVQYVTFADEDVGYEIDLPLGWQMEVPGGKREFHGFGDYKGKRVLIETEILGKLAEPSFSSIAPALEYAQGIAKQVEGLNQGAIATVISADETNNGRIYFFEYRINSLEPQLVYGVAGVGLGQNASARKFKLRQRILVTCKVLENKVSERDIEILKTIQRSFTFSDMN